MSVICNYDSKHFLNEPEQQETHVLFHLTVLQRIENFHERTPNPTTTVILSGKKVSNEA